MVYVNGPINVIRLENLNENKNVHIFLLSPSTINNQTKCKNVDSIDMTKYVTDQINLTNKKKNITIYHENDVQTMVNDFSMNKRLDYVTTFYKFLKREQNKKTNSVVYKSLDSCGTFFRFIWNAVDDILLILQSNNVHNLSEKIKKNIAIIKYYINILKKILKNESSPNKEHKRITDFIKKILSQKKIKDTKGKKIINQIIKKCNKNIALVEKLLENTEKHIDDFFSINHYEKNFIKCDSFNEYFETSMDSHLHMFISKMKHDIDMIEIIIINIINILQDTTFILDVHQGVKTSIVFVFRNHLPFILYELINKLNFSITHCAHSSRSLKTCENIISKTSLDEIGIVVAKLFYGDTAKNFQLQCVNLSKFPSGF
jgi:hypothetical protein